MVICTVCKERFDRDKIQAVKSGARRYAHFKCKQDGEIVPLPQVDEDLLKLEQYIKHLLDEEYVNPRVRKQINNFKEEYNFSYSGILKSLIYFYEVKGNSKDKARETGGIGIVPFVYKEARQYYFDLFMAQNQNQSKDVASLVSQEKEVTIKPPSVFIKKRMFNLDDDNEKEFMNE